MQMTTLRALPALLFLAFSGSTAAAGFQLWEQNASGLGTAYAGSAAIADNASTLYYNPAGMSRLEGIQVSLGASAVRPVIDFSNHGSSVSGLAAVAGDGGDAGRWVAAPNAYVSWAVAPQWTVGVGLSSPFGLDTKYDTHWAGSYQAVESKITTANLNPSVAYQVNDKVALGFGVNYQTIDAKLTRLNAAGALAEVHGTDGAWGWNAGALFTLSPAMRVGISYRSAIKYKLDTTTKNGGIGSSSTADLKLPDTFIMSVWQQVSDRWEAMGDLSYTNWSTVSGNGLVDDFGFKDSWRFAWGAAYKYSADTKLKFGVAYEHAPVADYNRTARLPDANRLWLTVGAQYRLAPRSTIDVGYAYIYARDSDVSYTRNLGAGSSTLLGEYANSGHVLGVQYSQGF
jgi:long-chain fatty acid transport protein